MSIKVAQIGLGYWGKNLLRVLNNLGVLSAAFDMDSKVVDKYSKDNLYHNVYFGTDWETILTDETIKAVFIASPPNVHYDMAMKALKAKKHVFIEKPMTLSVDEAEEIVSYAKECGLIVMVGFIFLYSPEIIKLKSIVDSTDFGDINYIYTERLNLGQIQACGCLYDLMPHDISIVEYITAETCNSVSAFGVSNVLNGVEDVVFINMKYGDTLVHLHLSWLNPLKVRNTVVVGTKQMAVCDSINKRIDIYNKSVDISAMENNMSIDYARHLLSYRYGDVVSPHIETYEPLTEECKEFISCIDEGREPLSSGSVGLSTVKTLVAARDSLTKNGEWVEL